MYSGKRFIIHYLQPHAPYLTRGMVYPLGFIPPQLERSNVLMGVRSQKNTHFAQAWARAFLPKQSRSIVGSLVSKINELTCRQITWKINKLLNLPPITPMDAVLRRLGNTGLKEAYADNLKLVLKYVSELVKTLPYTIVITADHGELLGEGGRYSHPSASKNPLLREIPWLTISKKR